MIKRYSSTALIIIIVVLTCLVLFNKYYLSKKSESTFNDEFVKIDTSLVNEILIYPLAEKGKEIKLSKLAKGWEVSSDKVKALSDTSAVKNLLSSFSEIKSNALAAADKSGWQELQIDDSAGSRIVIKTTDNKSFDMVVGKFGYNSSSRNGVSYIRHKDEEAVYAIDGFLSFTVNQPMSAWRNRTFIKGNKNDWNMLTFTYPGDSSFVLSKQGNVWMVNGQPADSAKTALYLESISALQCSGFVDSYIPVSTPVFSLSILGNNQSKPLTVNAYPGDSLQKFILHSTLNPDAWFSNAQSQVAEKVFTGSGNFIAR